MIDRSLLYQTWSGFYGTYSPEDRIPLVQDTLRSLEGRMRHLGKCPGPYYHEFNKRDLNLVLGMALGVHKQLLAGLTCAPWGGSLKGAGGNRLG